MWKLDLLLALEKWNPELLIDNIRLNAYGEIVVEDTSHRFYIYREGTWIKFK